MKFKSVVTFLVMVMIFGAFLCAQAGLKERMIKRAPLIDALKDQGKLGENNLGKLEARTGLNPGEKRLMDEENNDRDTVYRNIAAKINVTPEVVGKRRAVKIAEKAQPGHWLQNPQGQWYRKK